MLMLGTTGRYHGTVPTVGTVGTYGTVPTVSTVGIQAVPLYNG